MTHIARIRLTPAMLVSIPADQPSALLAQFQHALNEAKATGRRAAEAYEAAGFRNTARQLRLACETDEDAPLDFVMEKISDALSVDRSTADRLAAMNSRSAE